MDENKFIEVIISEVHDSSVEDVVESLRHPPSGRKPNKNLIALYKWFSGLSESDKNMIKKVIEHSVHSSLFGFFAVLDGAREIEDGAKQGEFNLTYKNTDGEFLLSENNELHDEYQHQIYEKVFG